MIEFEPTVVHPAFPAVALAPPTLVGRPKEDRYKAFCQEIDAVKEKALGRMGATDVAYVRNLNRFSRAMEVTGRALIHFSFEPILFVVGVVALWLHKQLQATEIGHTDAPSRCETLSMGAPWTDASARHCAVLRLPRPVSAYGPFITVTVKTVK